MKKYENYGNPIFIVRKNKHISSKQFLCLDNSQTKTPPKFLPEGQQGFFLVAKNILVALLEGTKVLRFVLFVKKIEELGEGYEKNF